MLAAEAAVRLIAICFACQADSVGIGAQGLRSEGERLFVVRLTGQHGSQQVAHELHQFGVDSISRVAGFGKEFAQHLHEAVDIANGNHRCAVAYEGIVGVVPFGAKGVHPYTCTRDMVREFGEQRHKQFLCTCDEHRLAVMTGQQTCVLTILGNEGEDAPVRFIIEADGILGISNDLAIRLNAIRHSCKRELAHAKHVDECMRSVVTAKLDEFGEVDDLMVAPIADVRPRVVGIDNFPIDTFGCNAVRVVAIGRGCVEELGNDSVDVIGIRGRQGFPVLEDVTPVALIGNERFAFFVLDTDIEAVPRSRGIAMSARECQRQILHEQAVQLMIHAIDNTLLEFAAAHLFGQRAEERFVLLVQRMVEHLYMMRKIGSVDSIIVGIISSAHGVEEHVGKVACVLRLIASGLQAVVVRDDTAQVGGGSLQGFKHDLLVVGFVDLAKHLMYVGRIFLHIHYEHPLPTLACSHVHRFVQHVRALHALGFGFGSDGTAVAESVELLRRCEHCKILCINRVNGVASQAFTRFRLIDHY